MENILLKLKDYREKHSPLYIIKHSTIAIVGFIFSPLTWWNDIFINFPLAWIMTWLPLKLISLALPIHQYVFIGLFIINYWITNIIGMIMMHYSGKKLVNKDATFDFRHDVVITIIYTIVIATFFYLVPDAALENLKVLPEWVV